MIQAVKFNQNVSFKGAEAQQPQAQEASADNKKAKGAFESLRDTTVNTIKDVNEVTSTTAGIVRGVAGGVVGAAAVGVLGKNIKLSKGNILGTIKGSLKDLSAGAAKALKFIPSVLTKSPVKNLQVAAGLPTKFFGTYLKGHKITAALAGVTALTIAAFRTVQGKMNGNLKNANVDHRLNRGHVDA